MTTQDSNSNGSIANQIIVTGNVAFAPEFVYLQSGTAVCKTKLYCTRRWEDKATGEKKEKTVETKIIAYGEKAEAMRDAIGLGDLVEITGQLENPEGYLSKKEVNADGTPKVMAVNVITVREGRVIFTKRTEGQAPAQQDAQAPAVDANAPPLPAGYDELGDIPF